MEDGMWKRGVWLVAREMGENGGEGEFGHPGWVIRKREGRCSSLLFLFSFLPLSLSIPTANVTLDPDTAHPCLLLSEDHKTVRMGHKMQKVPDNPKRFSYYTFVLGREGFTAGRHSWEVRVGSEGAWAVGVTRESVDRKGLVYFCPEDGFWVLLYSQGTYEACIDPSSALPVSGEPKTIRVSLNCDGGWVAFHDADRGSLLYVFSGVSFAGETLFPFFYVGDDALLTISS
ncbi:Butyrophilin subfamily 2 member A2 [Varanus komodoensis]|nr:Butyrophilin subfamily 2 member A2 [Varanus komodoensis]